MKFSGEKTFTDPIRAKIIYMHKGNEYSDLCVSAGETLWKCKAIDNANDTVSNFSVGDEITLTKTKIEYLDGELEQLYILEVECEQS